MNSKLLCCIVLASLVTKSYQVMFHMQPNTQKCLKEQLGKGVIVAGEFDVQEVFGQSVDLQVTDSNGHILFSRVDAKQGKFVFNTETDDAYDVCFISKVPPTAKGMQQEISVKVKHGVEAKSYEALGEAAKLKPLEIELKKLEDLSSDIVSGFSQMRVSEEQMRDTNESTNSRVLYFSIFSLGCLIVLATVQVLYLRKFFRSKKLIE